MALVFWNAEGILFIDYLEKGKTITGEYYSNLLTRLDGKIREKTPSLQKKKIIFHHDNAPVHSALSIRQFCAKYQMTVLSCPPYSPDLTPCDFFLFPKLKSVIKGHHFDIIDDIKQIHHKH